MPGSPVRNALLALLVLCLLAACARRVPDLTSLPPAPPDAEPYRVQPGDNVEVRFVHHPGENQRAVVRADGGLALGVTGDIRAEGLSIRELEDLIRIRSSRLLRDPLVNVTVNESGARAYVGGEVSSSGFVTLNKPMTVFQAVLERGGFTSGADLSEVVVISRAGHESVTRRVDVARALAGEPVEGALLAPDDVVFVPKTGIARANSWMNRWIDGLTPQLLKGLRFPAF